MNYNDLRSILEKERIERESKVWYERMSLNFGEFLWYRVILRINDLPREIKWKLQEWTRGYSDCDIWNLNNFIVRKVRVPFKKFVKFYEERGNSFPNEFENNPAEWLVILKKIEYSFDHHDEITLDMTPEQNMENYKKVQEGFELFGRYITAFWD